MKVPGQVQTIKTVRSRISRKRYEIERKCQKKLNSPVMYGLSNSKNIFDLG